MTKRFYSKKFTLFIALYLFAIIVIMQGDRFFKPIKWLADFSGLLNFQCVEEVFDEGTGRFTKLIYSSAHLFPSIDDENSLYLVPLFSFYVLVAISLTLLKNTPVYQSYTSFFFYKLYLKYCILRC
jgi:hypothetical protein